jgi:VWFA-related protein
MDMCIAAASRLAFVPLLLGMTVFVPAPVTGQIEAPRKVFRSRSDVVLLHVSVVDRKAGYVPGLPREAFSVYENGRPQTVTFFQNEDTPVTVGLVIDSSGSMRYKRDAVIAAGLAFARSSHPGDEMFTINFNERVWSGLPPGLPFTSTIADLERALQRSTARGETALFDALLVSFGHLEKGGQQKKVLIVVSDGEDNASTARFEDVLEAALRTDAVIYTIGLSDEYEKANPKLLRKLAKATGADAFFPRDPRETTRILERIARDIRSGYTIGYAPADQDERFRAIRVTVTSPQGRNLSVRARSGYLPPAVESHDR